MNKYSNILDKTTKKLIQYNFDHEVNHRNRKTKTKIKPCQNEIKTDFHDERSSIKQIPCLTYSLILIDSVYKSDKNYYLKHF